MLINQPSIMWMHGGALPRFQSVCCWLSSLFPKVFASMVLSWAEYVSLTQLYRHYSYQLAFSLPSLVLSVLYVLSIYTYFKIIHVGPGSPLDYEELRKDSRSMVDPSSPYGTMSPQNTHTTEEISDPESRPLTQTQSSRYTPSEFLVSHQFRNNEPAFRWCNTCEVWKPDRCHHCSTCQKCFLRMDHHCPWFASCIGFKNHKFFVQVLLYITGFSGAVCATSTWLLYDFFANSQYEDGYLSLNLVFLFVVSLAFFIAVGCFAAFSLYMVLRNYTTIEFQDEKWSYSGDRSTQYEFDNGGKKQKLGHLYDLGYKKNWTSVMGSSWIHWILPVTVTGSSSVYSANNGLNFEVQESVFQKYLYNAQLQEQLNAQLAEYRDRVRGKRAEH